MKPITLYLGFFLFFMALASCEKTDVMPDFNNRQERIISEKYTGDYITLEFTASENSLRSMFPIEDKSANSKTSIKIKWEKGKEYDIKCVLYNKNNQLQTSFQDIKVVVNDVREDGTATIKYKGTIQLANGSLAGGEWYMQLFMGLDSKYWNNSSKQYELGQRIIEFDDDNDGKISLDIPIACPWTKLDVNVAGNHVKAPTVQLNPMGAIFALEIENPLCDPLSLKRLTLNTSLFRSLGYFRLGQFQSGSMPKFEALQSYVSSRTGVTSSFEINYTFPANYTSRKTQKSPKLYFWTMPNSTIVSADILGKLYVSNDKNEYGIPIKANNYAGSTGLQERTAQKIVMKIEDSDLMITEFYHYNPSGGNFSMIEIYNPTYKDIDLSKYFLIRERHITKDVAGFQPTDDVNMIENALRQDIYISDTEKDQPTKTVDGRMSSDVHGELCLGSINRYKLLFGNYNKMLPPGKTVILCSGGVYSIIDSYGSYDFPYMGKYIERSKTNNNIHYMITVDNGSAPNSEQFRRHGGTFQHGQKHVMILLKEGKPIDVTGPFTYKSKNISSNLNRPEDYDKLSTTEIYQNYIAFTQQVGILTNEGDWMNLVRRDWDFYPSPYWDNNKGIEGKNVWDTDSRWMMVCKKGAAGSEISSWGTRTTIDSYLDREYIEENKQNFVYYPIRY